MRINGTEVTRRNVEIEVSDTDLLEALRVRVYQSVGLRPDMFLDSNGRLVYDEENYHGSDTRHIVTEAPLMIQLKTIEAFNHIRIMLIRD
jgi:hypothetical protein